MDTHSIRPAVTRMSPRRWRRACAGAVVVIVTGLGAATLAGRFPPLKRVSPPPEDYQAKALQRLRERVRGVAVYELSRDNKHSGIWKTHLGELEAIRLTRDGRYPRLSPDGRLVAFLRGDAQIRLMTIQGRHQRLLHSGSSRIPAISYHPNGREIVYLENGEVRSLEIATGRISTLRKIPVPAAVDVSADGRLLIVSTNDKGRHEMHACRLPDGEWIPLGRGCSAAVSPDGSMISDNIDTHRYLRLRGTTDFREAGRVPAPRGMTIDNEAWSNLSDWIAYRSEPRNHRFIWIYHLGDPAPLQATFKRDADRPDVFLESAPFR